MVKKLLNSKENRPHSPTVHLDQKQYANAIAKITTVATAVTAGTITGLIPTGFSFFGEHLAITLNLREVNDTVRRARKDSAQVARSHTLFVNPETRVS